ncbi:carboxypeptidase-like regulatory domain-containing protein [Mesonia aquimarina]|uniref:carboxypeptidase-like regulatory domain-containing protein n=1 Tax=Mesonia aquimarina TaxID=1504967 RepID=UPI000EF5B54E|nr:carboxypeptidase-like regulatory domain-containing protein [Mesonia aquimarina]
MKNFLFTFLLFLFSISVFSQTPPRTLIQGKVNVEANASADGINVYNLNSLEGTITNEYGEFMIPVKLNDKLIFSALQYQEFTVIIDKSVIENKRLSVTINEAINELDEVTVRPYNLSGDVNVDVRKIRTTDFNEINESSEEMVETFGYEMRPDKYSAVENDAIDKSYLTNGLNFANIFRAIFNEDSEEPKHVDDIDVGVRKMYNDEFFKDNFDIKRENINEFIFYAEENGLTSEMLQKGNELKLIDFLLEKSKTYKAQQK